MPYGEQLNYAQWLAQYYATLNQQAATEAFAQGLYGSQGGISKSKAKTKTILKGNRPIYKEEKMPEIEIYQTGGVEKELLDFSVVRCDDGMKVKARSPELAKFFSAFQPAPVPGEPLIQKITKWGNMPIRKMDKFPVVENSTFERPGDLPIVNEYVVNLSWLRAEALGGGIEFVFKGVFSKSQTESFYNAARAAIKELFMEYLQNTEFRYVLTGKSSL